MLRFYTARHAYRGSDAISVSRRLVTHPLGVTFAPSDALLTQGLRAIAAGKLVDYFPTYAALYQQELRASYRKQPEAWSKLLALPEATLTCFCKQAELCHRSVLAACLECCGAVYLGERPTSLQLEIP